MFLNSIGTALPERRYTKAECWDAFVKSNWFERLSPRAHAIAKTVLRRDNGIEERWLAVESLAEVFAIDPDTLHRRFATHARNGESPFSSGAVERAQISSGSRHKSLDPLGGRAYDPPVLRVPVRLTRPFGGVVLLSIAGAQPR